MASKRELTNGKYVDDQMGNGVPEGGTTGQILAKASNDDFDTEWITGGGGGSGAVVQATGPLLVLPDILYVQAGAGGVGGAGCFDCIRGAWRCAVHADVGAGAGRRLGDIAGTQHLGGVSDAALCHTQSVHAWTVVFFHHHYGGRLGVQRHARLVFQCRAVVSRLCPGFAFFAILSSFGSGISSGQHSRCAARDCGVSGVWHGFGGAGCLPGCR